MPNKSNINFLEIFNIENVKYLIKIFNLLSIITQCIEIQNLLY